MCNLAPFFNGVLCQRIIPQVRDGTLMDRMEQIDADVTIANRPFALLVLSLQQMAKEKYRVQSTKYKVQSTKYRVQSTKYRVQSTGYRVQSTEYRVQSTEYRVQSLHEYLIPKT